MSLDDHLSFNKPKVMDCPKCRRKADFVKGRQWYRCKRCGYNLLEEETILLTEQNRDLLSRILLRGMSGSYYEPRAMPDGKDIAGYARKERDTISTTRLAEIAKYYSVWSSDILEWILDEERCEEWLYMRALPWDDPW
jgi:DNA-directed RNA polymerase subunit RPC12/RpoP